MAPGVSAASYRLWNFATTAWHGAESAYQSAAQTIRDTRTAVANWPRIQQAGRAISDAAYHPATRATASIVAQAARRVLLPNPPSKAPAPQTAAEDRRELRQNIDQWKEPAAHKQTFEPGELDGLVSQEAGQLIQNTTRFSIILLINPRATEDDAIQIIKVARQHPNASFLDVCIDEFQKKNKANSYLSRMAICLRYLIYYKFNIIPNLIKTFVNAFYTGAYQRLVEQKGGINLKKLANILLTEADSFLTKHKREMENFARSRQSSDTGNRDEWLYNHLFTNNLDEICDRCASVILREFLPPVPLFGTWTSHSSAFVRFGGRLLEKTVGAFLNKKIQKKLRAQLPFVIKSLIDSSSSATGHYAFKTAITDFITGQLREFRDKLNKKTVPPPQKSDEFPQIPALVDNFMDTLALETWTLPRDIIHYIENPPAPSPPTPGFIDRINQNLTDRIVNVDQEIKKSLIDGCQIFFSYLSNPKKSKELLYHVLTIINTIFDQKPLDTTDDVAAAEKDYQAAQITMERMSKDVFQALIRRSMEKRTQSKTGAEIEQERLDFEKSVKENHKQLVDSLNEAVRSINDKADLDIQEELADILTALKRWESEATSQEKAQDLDPSLRASAENVQHTISQCAKKLAEQAHQAQLAHQSFSSDAFLSKRLTQFLEAENATDGVPFGPLCEQLTGQLKTRLDSEEFKKHIDQLQTILSAWTKQETARQSLARFVDPTLYIFIRAKHVSLTKNSRKAPAVPKVPEDLSPEAQTACDTVLQQVANCTTSNALNTDLGKPIAEASQTYENQELETRKNFCRCISEWQLQIDESVATKEAHLRELLDALLKDDPASKGTTVQRQEHIWHGWRRNRDKLAADTAIYAFGGALAAGITAVMAPAAGLLGMAAAGILAGKKAVEAENAIIDRLADQNVLPRVVDFFDQAYRFALKKHIWHWAAVDAIVCLNGALSPNGEPVPKMVK